MRTEISIVDDGVGIFAHVQKYLQEKLERSVSYQDVLIELIPINANRTVLGMVKHVRKS